MNFSARKSMLDLILEGMKWRPLQKISGNKVSIAFLAVMCTTFVTWAWQKRPAMFVLFPSLEQFNILSSECDYAKGKWVAETRRPFYSGSSCRRWLSRAWACRLTKRSDFSYESFRWQPQGCEMREFRRNEFFWRYVRPANIVSVIISLYWKGTNWWMHTLLFSYEQSFSVECFKSLFEFRTQNKTIALVGDSLGRQQFQSLMCMVTGGEMSQEVEDVGKYYGLVKAPGVFRPDGWAYRFPSTNTTILYYWSASLCELEPLNTSDPATHFALHLDRPVTFLKQYLPRFDVLVLNTGHHWNSDKFRGNHWEMHAGGQPIVDGKLADLMNAKNLTLYSIARWVDSQLLQHPHLKAFLRTISPRHFVNGEWSAGGSCDNTVPLASGGQVLQDGSSDQLAEAAVKGTRVKLLDITALSQLREEGHISKYTNRATKNVSDCLHWCLPGIPDVWNEILYAQI